MELTMMSVMVDDQDRALAFYTEKLGFELVHDVPMGEHRWIALVSPEDPDGPQLILEPSSHPAAAPFKQALVADGIPLTSFGVADVEAEYERLLMLDDAFSQPPMVGGPATTAVLDDTVGNLIQILSMNE